MSGDMRLTLDVLDAIVRATESGQSLRSTEMTLPGWTREWVWRELSALRDDGLLRYENEPGVLSDHPDDPSLIVQGLTANGWEHYNELRRPVRSWLTSRWMWLVTTIVAVVGIVVAALWG
jgi:hypothetical protein